MRSLLALLVPKVRILTYSRERGRGADAARELGGVGGGGGCQVGRRVEQTQTAYRLAHRRTNAAGG